MNRPHLRYKHQTSRGRTWTIHFISLEKVVKATIAIALALKLLTLLGQDVHQWASDFVSRHGINLANRYVQNALERLIGVGNTQIYQISGVAFVYAGLLYVEGIGLWFQKRWAEYLTAIATALFIPVEIYEIFERFTWVRIAILVLNIFIVWYLVTRLRDEKKEAAAIDSDENALKRTRVKICGITNIEDARNAIENGADEIGFNFYAKSVRYISPTDAASIIRLLPPTVYKVGVFVNESVDEILKTSNIAGLDAIQLHGDESLEYVTELRGRTEMDVIKAVRINPSFDWQNALNFDVHAILFDAFSKNEYGGSGQTFDWAIARDAAKIIPCLYLAGGLTPENAAEAIRTVRPYAVDVASGVESSPGIKDRVKLAAFIKAAKEAL